MRSHLAFALVACLAAPSCKKGDGEGPAADTGGGAAATITLTTSAFAPNAVIPKPFSCEGNDKSPDLAWTGAPKGTKSFALIVDDPDAPGGTFTHWVLFDLPASTAALPPAASVGTAGKNDFDKVAWSGPCPPPGKGPHRYFFKLFALDLEKLGPKEGAPRDEVEKAMKGHVLGRGELVGTFSR
jgi:Raf kinase inhibitor-like YbhB/YbcL family protein